jgi:hypothetical protein
LPEDIAVMIFAVKLIDGKERKLGNKREWEVHHYFFI